MARLARASAIKFGVNIFETVAGALATVFFANVLGSGPLGQYFLAIAVVNWLLILPVGVRTATTKRVSEGEAQDDFYSSGLLLTVSLLSIAALGVVLFANPLATYLGAPIAGLVAVLVVTKGGLFFVVDALRGEDRVEVASLVEGGWTLLRVGFQVGLVVVQMSVVALLIGEIVSAVVVAAVGGVIVSLTVTRPSMSHVKDILGYARYAWFGNLKVMAYSWMDTLVLGFFVTNSAVGIYEVAWRVTALFILLPTAIGNVVFPTVSREAADGNYETLETLLERILSFAPLFALPGLFGAAVIGEEVLGIYGPEFRAGFLVLVVLSVGRVVESFETILVQSLNALDYPERAFRVNLVFTGVNLAANVVFIWQFGPLGAALATTASMLLSVTVALVVFPSEVSVSVSVSDIGAQCASALLMGALVAVLVTLRPPASILETVGYVSLGVFVYGFAVVALSRTLRDQLRESVPDSVPFSHF